MAAAGFAVRIRSLKPEFWSSEDVAALGDYFDRLLFIGLWSYVDDNAVGRDNDKLIAAKLFPLEEDPFDVLARIRRGLATLSGRGLIARYTSSDGKRLLMVNGWHHQKIDKPTRSPLPRLDEDYGAVTWEDTPPTPTVAEPSPTPREDSRAPRESSPDGSRDPGPGTRDLGIRDTGSRDQTPRARARERTPLEPALVAVPDQTPLQPTPRRFSPDFDDFWQAYPNQYQAPNAWRAWNHALNRATPEVILTAARRYRDDPNRPFGYEPAPAKWLTEDGWLNGPCPSRQPSTRAGPARADVRAQQAVDAGRQLAAMRANGTTTHQQLGTAP